MKPKVSIIRIIETEEGQIGIDIQGDCSQMAINYGLDMAKALLMKEAFKSSQVQSMQQRLEKVLSHGS